jgi:hypothetical protein
LKEAANTQAGVKTEEKLDVIDAKEEGLRESCLKVVEVVLASLTDNE